MWLAKSEVMWTWYCDSRQFHALLTIFNFDFHGTLSTEVKRQHGRDDVIILGDFAHILISVHHDHMIHDHYYLLDDHINNIMRIEKPHLYMALSLHAQMNIFNVYSKLVTLHNIKQFITWISFTRLKHVAALCNIPQRINPTPESSSKEC